MGKKTVTVKEIQRLDKIAIEQYGVPSLALMENAGRSVAYEVIRKVKKNNSRVAVVCGLGNNAGDGFVVARHLINAGVLTDIIVIGQGKQLKHDAAVNYRILKRLKYPINEIKMAKTLSAQMVKKADIVVDAIFGVGLSREVIGLYRDIIDVINKSGKKVISIDVPSGLNATTGEIYGICIKADMTVTFSLLKKGFFKKQGPKHTGKIIVVDIGIPLKLKGKIS